MSEDRVDSETNAELQPIQSGNDLEQEDEFPIPSELLEGMPPEGRRAFTQAFSSITQFAGPVFNPVLRRITSEHITQVLNSSEAQSNREAEAERSNRRFQFGYFVIGLAALLFLLVFFTLREQYHLLAAVVTGAMGFGSGFGIGKFTGRR